MTTNLNKMYPMNMAICRMDLKEDGYDVSDIIDETMQALADDMVEGLMNHYWETLGALTAQHNIKRI